jgi:hypothetical protein
LWKALGKSESTCRQLLGQLASYKENEPPFNDPFEPDCQTPQTWWKTVEDIYNHLPSLAINLLTITPHSASCERVFSTLGWIYGKKRTRLAFEKVEALAKVHRYYTTHAKEEISYINRELTLEDILIVANETSELGDDNSDEDYDEDNETEFESYDEALNLEGSFDLNHEIFREQGENNIQLGPEDVVEKEPNYDYNVDSLVDEIFI